MFARQQIAEPAWGVLTSSFGSATRRAVPSASSVAAEPAAPSGYRTAVIGARRSNDSDEEAFSLVESVAAKTAATLPGLGFLAPGGVLDLPLTGARVLALLLELPPGQSLQLQSIGLTAEGIDDLAPLTTVTASSGPVAAGPVDVAALLDLDRSGRPLIETDHDHPAWLELRFARPVRLTRLRLRNVDAASARQARGIGVTALATFRRATPVYDGRADLRELDHLIATLRAVAPANALLRRLLPTFRQVLRADYEAAWQEFSELEGISEAERTRFLTVLATRLLSVREQAWPAQPTPHPRRAQRAVTRFAVA